MQTNESIAKMGETIVEGIKKAFEESFARSSLTAGHANHSGHFQANQTFHQPYYNPLRFQFEIADHRPSFTEPYFLSPHDRCRAPIRDPIVASQREDLTSRLSDWYSHREEQTPRRF